MLLVVGGVLVVQAVDRRNAVEAYESAAARADMATATADTALDEALDIFDLPSDPYLPFDALDRVIDTIEPASFAIADVDDLITTSLDPLSTDDIRGLTSDLNDAVTHVAATESAMLDAFGSLRDATRDTAPAFDEAHVDGNNEPRIAFRDAAAELEYASDDQTAEVLAAYLDAAESLAASHEAELAEKAGPLFAARMAVQEYARSIDGGVMLEFDWAPLVNGYGSGSSYGGTSYWVSDHGGYATITLSDSVARMWPGAGVRALVTHEVGHAILSRPDCYDLYFGSEFDLGNEESWATAWAIGMGQTADGSGESIYGRPPEGLITLSQQCR